MDDGPAVGKITKGIGQDQSVVLETIWFVRQQLLAWRDDPHRQEELSENKLNAQLCKFLETRARYDHPMVRFDHEEDQEGRHRVDIAASPNKAMTISAKLYTIYAPFLVIEGKRLPAPERRREREYVSGGAERTGGIQRFKLGLHGAALDVAAMIAYIQNDSADAWHGRVNQWISDLAKGSEKDVCKWHDAELLQWYGDQPTEIAGFRSVHSRKTEKVEDHITIYHLWVNMNDRQTVN